jgi:protein pelota
VKSIYISSWLLLIGIAVKIIEKNLQKNFMKLIPTSEDDLWHLYNVIYKEDEVYTYSSRAIKAESEYSRPKSAERISAFVGIIVEYIAWDKFLGRLRVHGVICHGPENIPKGVHHTITISLNKPVTLVKENWPRHILKRLKKATINEKPIIIVSIDDESFAVAQTKQYGVDIKVEERIKLPGKRNPEYRKKATKEYFKRVLDSINQIWIITHSPIIILGVGFIKNNFAAYLKKESTEISKSVADIKSVNTGGSAGILESLRSGVLLKAAHKLRIIKETEIIEEVMKRLGKEDQTVSYGFDLVENAAKLGAVERIVIADTMLRESLEDNRTKLDQLMKKVENQKGRISIISTEHEGGAKLLGLGGIVALLRFPIYSK